MYPTPTNDYIVTSTFTAMYIVWFIVAYAIAVIPTWKVFTKAGIPGWKSIIPVYNSYLLYKIAWKPSMFFVTLGLGVVYLILVAISAGIAAGGGSVGSAIAFLIIGLILIIGALVIEIMCYHKLSKSFGHGVGFTLGLIFLSIIFLYILAFGSSEYQGAQE